MRPATFPITRTGDLTKTVTFSYTTADDSATVADADYVAKTGTVTFLPGEVTKDVTVMVRNDIPGEPTEQFTLTGSGIVGGSFLRAAGICELSSESTPYLNRFNIMYGLLKDTDNGYFGPPTGPKAFTAPYHSRQKLIVEAPDWGHQSVSETASFWVALEACKGRLSGDWSGYAAAWASVEGNYIPNGTNQPVGSYNAEAPATYQPEGNLPSAYPTMPAPGEPVGVDPLYDELRTTYGSSIVYLMHWIHDIDGDYGYHNGDGTTTVVHINNYNRGLQESTFETVTHPSWEDFSFGNSYGYLPLYNQNKPTYPSSPFDYGKQWRYTCAPDAEVRVVQHAYLARRWAASTGGNVAAQDLKARKMGDYVRYAMFDKYFRQIGNGGAGGSWASPYSSCHYLIAWYTAWGGEIPAVGGTSAWGFRIGCSEAHFGYNSVNIAYYMATGGGGYAPQSPSAGDIWLGSLYRQIELIRWLQSPEGPIAGGVTNSWLARYETPTDGRQSARFYGMFYTYSPVWHDPTSNTWTGFQAWGLQRLAELLLEIATATTPLAMAIRPNLEIILDRFVNWLLNQVVFNTNGTFTLPTNLSWASNTQVVGQTATAPNLEGVYEYLPNRNWPGSGTPDYASFWSSGSVPNPNLHCSITARGVDIGVASCFARLLLEYAAAKRKMSKWTTAIPGGLHTAEEAFTVGKEILDRIWALYRDTYGLSVPEERADYERFADTVYIPSIYSGTMPNGDAIVPGATFISLRSFMQDAEGWDDVEAYLNGGDPPVFRYHRFWAQVEYACACAAIHTEFGDLV